MICPACGTENEKGFKFCVKCGSNLDDPKEVNYEQVDMGGYHTEEEFKSHSSGFTVGNGTFTISDRPSSSASSDIYTADELNDTEEEFDFSAYDEPYIPRLDADRLSLPRAGSEPIQPQNNQYNQGMPQMDGMPPQPPMNGMQGMPPMPGMPQMPNQQPPMGSNPYMNQQPVMYGQPPVIGYDASGMPIYGQPMVYGQAPVIGYDASGMPIYGQPMMYAQPPVIGYDASGMPIYGQAQPMMYGGQPSVIGYDAAGMPIYSQPMPVPDPMQGMQGMQGVQNPQNGMQGLPPMPNPYGNQMPAPSPKEEKKEELVDMSDDFWKFFDGGTATKHREETSDDDFFGKSSRSSGMNDLPSSGGMEMNSLKRSDKKKVNYMNDTPIVDANKLARNDADKFNKFYMRSTQTVNADDLEMNTRKKSKDYMGSAGEVDADMLSANVKQKSRITMYTAGEADPDKLEAYTPEHKKSLMAQADRAVEALPKRINPYESELDKIELPEYMKAKKTSREENIEIPSLPQVGIE